jgi:hypothetical protein
MSSEHVRDPEGLAEVMKELDKPQNRSPVGGPASAGRSPIERGDRMLPSHVVVTDVRMPFVSMVMFMVKWAIASIPAAVILFALWYFAARTILGLDSLGTPPRPATSAIAP